MGNILLLLAKTWCINTEGSYNDLLTAVLYIKYFPITLNKSLQIRSNQNYPNNSQSFRVGGWVLCIHTASRLIGYVYISTPSKSKPNSKHGVKVTFQFLFGFADKNPFSSHTLSLLCCWTFEIFSWPELKKKSSWKCSVQKLKSPSIFLLEKQLKFLKKLQC